MQSKYDNLFQRILDDDDGDDDDNDDDDNDDDAVATIVVFAEHYINTHDARKDQVLLFAIQ